MQSYHVSSQSTQFNEKKSRKDEYFSNQDQKLNILDGSMIQEYGSLELGSSKFKSIISHANYNQFISHVLPLVIYDAQYTSGYRLKNLYFLW